jgi:hypothetical protein
MLRYQLKVWPDNVMIVDHDGYRNIIREWENEFALRIMGDGDQVVDLPEHRDLTSRNFIISWS